MAIKEVDWVDLGNKADNVESSQGKLTAEEWNGFVAKVKSYDDSIKTLSSAKIEGVRFNGQAYTEIVTVKDEDTGKTYRCIDVPADKSARTVTFVWIPEDSEPNNITVANNASIPLTFKILDVDINEKPFDGKGIINIYVDDDRTHTIVNVGHNSLVEFDLMKVTSNKLATPGSHTVKIEYNNNNKIEPKYIAVNVISLNLTIDNFKNFYTTESTSWPTAYLTKNSTLHYVIKNANAGDITGSEVATYTEMSLENILKRSKHGVNNITLWNSIDTDGVPIKTDEQNFKYAYVANTNEVIIMSDVLNNDSFDLYNNVNIGFTAYISNAASGEKDVKVGLYNNDALVFDEKSVKINVIKNVGSGSASFSLVPDSKFDKETILGINKIRITVDSYTDETIISINNVEVSYHEVPGYDVYFNADNNSNQISHEWVSSGNISPIAMQFDNVPFIDGASGWYTDKDNGTSLKLKRNSYCTLDYKPFAINPAYLDGKDNSGLTISIEFATSNCSKDNASVIKCIDPDTGHGFEVTASNAILKSSNKTLRAKFKEDTRLRLDFVIEGKTTTYTQKSWVPKNPDKPAEGQEPATAPSTEAMMLMYIDGVYVGIAEYGTTGGTDFRQQLPQSIIFGSDLCDLDIYKIRIYKKALNCVEIVDNYAYDANGVANKTSIALRNNIFADAETQGPKRNKPDIDLTKLRKARPDLPIFTVRLDDKHNNNEDPALRGELTNNKKDWQLCSLSYFDNPLVKVRQEDIALNSWQANTGTIRNQGTSSMGYPWPWRNWDWKTGDSDHGTPSNDMKFYFPTIENGVSASKWPQYQYRWDASTALMKKLTFKKDYASSEMCNNAICSELFTDFATMLASSNAEYIDSLLTPAMAVEWKSNNDSTGAPKNSSDFRFSLKAKPCFMVQELSYDPKGGDPSMIAGTAGLGKDALGMMNLIPNKNEVRYLGFKKNRWEDFKWSEKNGVVQIEDDSIKDEDYREQAWELRENKDGVYWRYHIDPAHIDNETGEFKNEIFDHYEARTPKDSPIFDADFGDIDTKVFDADKHLNAMVDQTKDLCRLHNWFVDTNRELATGKQIKDLYTSEELNALKTKYGYSNDWDEKYDLPNSGPDPKGKSYEPWRLLRFRTEAKDYLIEKQWILYYIWRELFWMFDSGFKNLQVYTLDGQHWGTMVRDADTALGIENTGKDIFAPHLEDIDGYRSVNGKIEYGYGVAKDVFHLSELAQKGYNHVLNGQFGSVWVNIRDGWSQDIAKMFKDLVNIKTGLTTDFVINKFRNHQEHWCEALYNFGMRQYFAGDAYRNNISAGLGDKKHSRAQWLERAMYYRTSKYKAFEASDYMYCRRCFQDKLYVSDTASNSDIKPVSDNEQRLVTFKSYIPTYIWCGGDNNQANNPFRLIDVNNDNDYSITIDAINADELNLDTAGADQNTAIYGTSYITDMGDLFKYCKLTKNPQTLNMPMLEKLEFGHDYRRDNQKYWTLDNGKYVEWKNERPVVTIDLSLMKKLTLLDMTNHTNLDTISGLDKCTQLEAVYISGTAVNTLNLPQTSTIKKLYLNDKLSNITFDNLINLEDVRIDGYKNVSKVYITNCNEYMQSKSLEIITNCIDNLVKYYNPDGEPNCTVTGINWESLDYEILEKLVSINADIKGHIHVNKMTPELKIKLINKYDAIDSSSNALYITYDPTYVDNFGFNRTEYYIEPGTSSYDFSNELKFNPTNANTLINTSWSISNNDAVEIDPVTGVVSRKPDKLLYEQEDPITVKAIITQIVPAAGYNAELESTTKLYLKPHIAKPGDIVYADGSFSSEIIESAKPIGICFYVDPENHKNRLMHALEYVNTTDKSWGMGNYYSGNYTDHAGVSPEGFPSNYYDIDSITNYNNLGITIPKGVDTFGDESGYITNNAFNSQLLNGPYALREIGFKESDKEIKVIPNYSKKDSPIKYVSKNEYVPYGLYNTLHIINKRNQYLIVDENNTDFEKANAFVNKQENGTSIISLENAIPYSTDTITEKTMLDNNINRVATVSTVMGSNTKISATTNMDLYYPAASYCWAYSPNADNLNPKFKEHNWFLPAAGDAYRIAFYLNCLFNDTSKLEKYKELTSNFTKFKPQTSLYNKLKNISSIISCTEFVLSNFGGNNSMPVVGAVKIGRTGISSTDSTNNIAAHKGSNVDGLLPICKF